MKLFSLLFLIFTSLSFSAQSTHVFFINFEKEFNDFDYTFFKNVHAPALIDTINKYDKVILILTEAEITHIATTGEDAVELMKKALSKASKRVVLKWPLRASPMEGICDASHQILGKSTRYDVFMVS